MRIVLDTNILISSLIQSRGNSALLIDAWLDGLYELVSSAVQLVEMRDVIERPRLQRFINLEEANELFNLIASEAVLVTLTIIEHLPFSHLRHGLLYIKLKLAKGMCRGLGLSLQLAVPLSSLGKTHLMVILKRITYLNQILYREVIN